MSKSKPYTDIDEVFTTSEVNEGNPLYDVSNKEINLAWHLISRTGTSVFLTGKAGTGKTTFLRKLRENLPKRMAILAPTGVAAINAHGQTIHSFFQLPFGPNIPGKTQDAHKSFRMTSKKKKIIRTLDLLVIDEISMVRCDLLDAIDAQLRKLKNPTRPFGGVQLLLIGDLQQLPPVAKDSEWDLLKDHYSSPYFFDSKALRKIRYATIELKHIYRQQDKEFIDILANIRHNNADAATLAALNRRYKPGFIPPEEDGWIRLTTHNKMADDYNNQMLANLPGEEHVFTAKVKGDFPESIYPAEKSLTLKVGAQVMFLKNDPTGKREYYNGKIGVIEEFGDGCIVVFSQEDGTRIKVPQVTWENTKYIIDNKSDEIKESVEGTFIQYPLRLAWAITVHKSQGLTFDHAILDINSSFAHGQTYVALSRCRTLEGLVLANPISARSIITDPLVDRFIDISVQQSINLDEHILQLEQEYFLSLVNEAFDFRPISAKLNYLTRIISEHLAKQQAVLLSEMHEAIPKVDVELVAVAERFASWCNANVYASPKPENDEALQTRIKNGANYFYEKLDEIFLSIIKKGEIKILNKQVAKQYHNAHTNFMAELGILCDVLTHIAKHGFEVKSYLKVKNSATIKFTDD